MISKTTKNRFSYKLDKLMWFMLAFLPIFCYLLVNFRNPAAVDFFSYVSSFNPFPLIENVFNTVTQTAFGSTFALNSLIAYMVSVEIVHILFDVVVFIPRLAHKWIGKVVQDD